MKYYLDTEFHEYKKKPLFGKPIDTIELISIGIITEKFPPGEEDCPPLVHKSHSYYAVCNEFDLKAAWNNEWLRENVLRPIWVELNQKMRTVHKTYCSSTTDWTYKGMKRLLIWMGKSRKEIADDIKSFTKIYSENPTEIWDKPEFYAYFGDYDWVVFCWLFGRMIDLPTGFPMYCRDLKQMLDDMVSETTFITPDKKGKWKGSEDIDGAIKVLKESSESLHPMGSRRFPKQVNEHNALADAKWNRELHEYIISK